MGRRKRGRPTLDSEQLRQKIGSHILDGMNLHQIAKLPDMPGYRTLTRWVKTKPEFREWVQALQLDYEEERYQRLLEDLRAYHSDSDEHDGEEEQYYLEIPEFDDDELRGIERLLRSFQTSTRA